ncbi:MAG: hemerythrin domain-containing protein [Candidatus Solibacter usitatus]|nr:hemerythrin domain-containing protein [Candidatus Solibacter usitatus]
MSSFIPRPTLDLIDLLLGEHAALLSLLRYLDNHRPSMDLTALREAARALEAVLMAHAIEEDSLLFHALPADQRGVRETLDAMFAEHNEQRRLLSELLAAEELPAARSLMKRVIELTREHFAVEERVLFGLARQILPLERLTDLGAEFARRRGISRPS